MPHMDPLIGQDGGVEFRVGAPCTVVGGIVNSDGESKATQAKKAACQAVHSVTGFSDTNSKMCAGALIALAAFFLGKYVLKKFLKISIRRR